MTAHRLYITKHLKALADEVTEAKADGTTVTRAEAVASALWERALGYTDGKDKYHPPSQWAIACILERLEGRVGTTEEAKGTGPSISERIHELSRNRLNKLADNAVARDDPGTQGTIPGHSADLDGPDNRDKSS